RALDNRERLKAGWKEDRASSTPTQKEEAMADRPRIYSMLALAAAIVLAISASTIAPRAGSANGQGAASGGLNPADFSTNVTNPLFPLSTLVPKVFEGQETDPDTGEVIATRLESTVLSKTRKVAGVEVLVLKEDVFANGQLVERAL